MARTTGRKRFWFQQQREITETLESKDINKNAQQLTQ
tara:strand:- start:18732 stop:18842 length:111 start_codon:yes stop_codon:yes gene_type:complete